MALNRRCMRSCSGRTEIGVRPVEQMRQGFDQRHLGAKCLIHGAQFQADVAAADDQAGVRESAVSPVHPSNPSREGRPL